MRLARTQDRIAIRRFLRWRSPVGKGAKQSVPTLVDKNKGKDETRAEIGSEFWEGAGAWEEDRAGEDVANESGPGGKDETEE